MTASTYKRYGVQQIKDIKDRGIFFDTNVLLILFRPGEEKGPRYYKYVSIFAAILTNRLKVFVNEITLSEFYNILFQRAWHGSNYPFVKEFRDSEAGIEAREEIYGYMKAILQQLQYVPSNLSLSEMTNQFTVDSLDFNDKLIAETCRKNNFVLVTDDADYVDSEIDVLSANTVMFA